MPLWLYFLSFYVVFAGPRVNDGGSSDSNALRPTRQVLLTAPVDARPVASSTGSGRAANPSSSSLSQPADIDSVALAAAAGRLNNP